MDANAVVDAEMAVEDARVAALVAQREYYDAYLKWELAKENYIRLLGEKD